jgi:hypothetical protein
MATADALETDLARSTQQLLDALVQGDPGALGELVSPDCQIIGPKGYRISKEEWVETHSAQIYEQVLLEALETDVRRHGDAAVCSQLQRSECRYRGEVITGLFRVLSVWIHAADAWRLVAVQYTAVAPEVDAGDAAREDT